MTARHAGQNTSRPDYAYTGRHEAPARPAGCTAMTAVASGDGEAGGLLVCHWAAHDGREHYDQADHVYWYLDDGQAPVPAEPVPAGDIVHDCGGAAECFCGVPAGAVA